MGTRPINPAGELLLACARRTIDEPARARIRQLLQEHLDWVQVLTLALEHRVAPLLYLHVGDVAPELVPEEAAEFLQSYFVRNAERNNSLAQELCRLLDLFRANGIQALPFLGPVFAQDFYGDIALRYFDDLDFLVHPQDILKAKDLLYADDFRANFHFSPQQGAAFARAGNAFQLQRSRDRVNVRLHCTLAPLAFAAPLPPGSLWDRLQPVQFNGLQLHTLAPEIQVLFSCIEGGRDLWHRLICLGDIAAILEAHKDLDWDKLLETARGVGCLRVLFIGLSLAKDLLDAEVPQDVLRQVAADQAATFLAAKSKKWLFADSLNAAGELQTLRFHLQARERRRDRVSCLLRRAMTPDLGDWRFASLPGPLHFLYYPLRPVRVGLRLLQHLFTRTALDLAPFVPTPMPVVERMLEMPELTPEDIVYDIGCGDGRIVILAAKKYGARGVGIEIDPQRIAEANKNAAEAGVQHLVSFVQQDAKAVDFSPATVVTLYLLPTSNLRFRLKLEKELPHGARLVAHRFDMAEWAPVKTEIVNLPNGGAHTLYMWRIEKPGRRA